MCLEKISAWVMDADNKRPATKASIVRKLRACAKHDAEFLEDPVSTVENFYTNKNTSLDLMLTFRSLNILCPYFSLSPSQKERMEMLIALLSDERNSSYEARARRPTDVAWSDVLSLEPSIKKRNLLIYRLFTLIPPQRNADFANMRIVEHRDDKADNIYVKSEHKFVFRDYKNSRVRGHHIVSVPQDIADIIPNQTYMFQKKSGIPIGFAALSNRIVTCFSGLGPGVGAITLRRSFASHQLASGMSGLELLHASNASSHSMAMHRYYAFKQ